MGTLLISAKEVSNIRQIDTFSSGIKLSRPTYFVGDVHGRADLLAEMLRKIDAHVDGNSVNSPRLVMLGDYIDRGDDSSKVLKRLYEMTDDYPDSVVCLMGNHEQMMLGFLDNPTSSKRSWLRHGGLQTLASFGVPMAGFGEHPKESALFDASEILREKLGPLEPWLRQLPMFWKDNNLYAIHAGANPYLPIEEQPLRTLLWGHRDFGRVKRTDGHWIVHGHTTVEQAVIRDCVVSIDTGAVYTGRLSVAFFSPEGTIELFDSNLNKYETRPFARMDAFRLLSQICTAPVRMGVNSFRLCCHQSQATHRRPQVQRHQPARGSHQHSPEVIDISLAQPAR